VIDEVSDLPFLSRASLFIPFPATTIAKPEARVREKWGNTDFIDHAD